jgi:biotin transport system substrate-specific component
LGIVANDLQATKVLVYNRLRPVSERKLKMSLTLAPRLTIIDRVIPRSIAADIALVASGALLTAVAAQLVIPASPVPFTFQTLSVLLVGAALGSVRGALSMLLYASLGIIGLPVFAPLADGSHATGLQAVMGATFGFVIGFIGAAFVIGYLAERTWSSHAVKMFVSYAVGSLVIYLFGVPVLAMVATGGDLSVAATIMAPYLIWDAVKAIAAALLFPLAWLGVNKLKG